MIREGAILVTGGHDILDDMSTLPLQSLPAAESAPAFQPEISANEQAICKALKTEDLLLDELIVATGLPLPEVNATLLKLEIVGKVQRLLGNRFASK